MVQGGLGVVQATLLLLLTPNWATSRALAPPNVLHQGRSLRQEQGSQTDPFTGAPLAPPPIDFAPLGAPEDGAALLAPASEGSTPRSLAPQLPQPTAQPGQAAARSDDTFQTLSALEPPVSVSPQQPTPSSGPAPASVGTGLPADLPPDLLPADLAFPTVSPVTGPSSSPAKPPGRGQVGQNISVLASLLEPPPPGVSPYVLSPEQQAAIPNFASLRKGKATVTYNRDVGNFDAGYMNCGMGYLSDYFKDYFVGIPEALYRTGELCGACVRMSCTDTVCQDALLRSRTFMIVDSCRDCKGNDLVISAKGFANLTGLNYDINPAAVIAWEFVSCAPLINGTIKMLPSDRNRRNYLGFNFSNLKALLRSVSINNLAFTRTPFGYWVIDTPEQDIPLKPPYDLALVGVNGQRLTKRLPSLRAQDLGVQF
ncbi:hypothetical protein N2152v2_005217 [Parachlorella kessleri]